MEDYIPIVPVSNWKNRFLPYHLHHLRNKAKHHENKIITQCSGIATPTVARLHSDAFWKELKELSSNKKEIDEYRETWNKIKPLAHLNSRQLLSLLQEEVIPLERVYQVLLKAFEDEKIKVEVNHLWPSHWFAPSINEHIFAIKQNQARLSCLKTAIHQGLLLRCQAHTSLNAPRNVDDIVSALCTKLNSFDLLKSPLQINTPYSETLDDDKRVTIYDCLEPSCVDKDNLHDMVLSSVPKKGYAAFKSAEEVKKNLLQCEKFYQITFDDLTSGSEDVFMPTWLKKIIPSAVSNAKKSILQSMKGFFSDIGMLSFVLKLWNLRYIAYLALTFMGYHYLALALQPVISILVGASAFAVFDSVLFYTLALAPVWAFGGMLLLSFKQSVVDYFTHWKKEEIYQSLDALISTQEFMANHLSHVIIDISHFDIKHLTEQVKVQSAKLRDSKESLNRFFPGEQFLCKGHISQKIDLVKARIKAQQRQLQTQLNQVSTHIASRVGEDIGLLEMDNVIASRVGEDIGLLEKSAAKEELVPIIPHQQLDKLKVLVETFGDKPALQQFEKNANPVYKWIDKIERSSKAQKAIGVSFAQPWGGHAVRRDHLRGWEITLKGYIPEGAKQEAALHIIKLLKGKSQPTQEQLEEWVNQLEIGDKAPHLLQKIQDHIFNTLKFEFPQNARLLSTNYKDLISSWYLLHKEEIKQAEDEIDRAFGTQEDDKLVVQLDSLGDERLSKIYELLDGADIYSYSCNQIPESNQRKNLARQYFEDYKGETSRAIRFLRFIPEGKKEATLIEVAKKRLNWLLGHLGQGVDPAKPFESTDIEIFHSYRLIQASHKFDFTTFIAQSTHFNNTWDQKVESFLDACRRKGFDSGKLAKKYKDRNHRIKPFILNQLELARKATPSTLQGAESTTQVSDFTSGRTIYVRH